MAKGDTDILPPASEFNAIFHQWDSVRAQLVTKDVDVWSVRPARTCLSPKGGLGFRIATQLDPYDALLITALGYHIGQDLEAARVPITDQVVFSHRFQPNPAGQLYRADVNFETFRRRSIELARLKGGMVVSTDIADFYQRIYVHPLENALRTAAPTKTDAVRVILKMMSGWNQSVSHGIPVGPAIFRLFAEVTIDDVDRALLSDGFTFCRYSDDYRIFVADQREARSALAFLSNILLRHHGLTIQESKTEIIPAEEWLDRFERTTEDQERESLKDKFETFVTELREHEQRDLEAKLESGELTAWDFFGIDTLDPYAEIDYEDLDDDQKAFVDSLNLWQILQDQVNSVGRLDIPLARFTLRRIAQLKLKGDYNILLDAIGRLYPVFPEVVMVLAEQVDDSDSLRREIGDSLLRLLDDPVVGHLEYHRNWILSPFSLGPGWNHADQLVQLYDKYSDQLTRPELVMALGSVGVAHWFRGRKQDLLSLPPWERRAFLTGARCLPTDEVKHWYGSVVSQLDDLEQVVLRWARSTLAATSH